MDTNNYNYYEEDDEISLLNLIGYVFRHLKKMLIVSIVVALVLGGLLGYKKSRVSKDDIYLETNYQQNNKKDYTAFKEVLDKKIDVATSDLDSYMDNNSFIRMNAKDSFQVKALYFVDTGYQIIPNSYYQNHDYTETVISAYVKKNEK